MLFVVRDYKKYKKMLVFSCFSHIIFYAASSKSVSMLRGIANLAYAVKFGGTIRFDSKKRSDTMLYWSIAEREQSSSSQHCYNYPYSSFSWKSQFV